MDQSAGSNMSVTLITKYLSRQTVVSSLYWMTSTSLDTNYIDNLKKDMLSCPTWLKYRLLDSFYEVKSALKVYFYYL